MSIEATLPKLRTRRQARRIKPPKLPRWLWRSLLFLVLSFITLFLDAVSFTRDPTMHNAVRLVGMACLTAGWWREVRLGLSAWKRAQDSDALPSQPVDLLTGAYFAAAICVLPALLVI